MSSEDEVNRFMVHGVAKTDWLFGDDHKVIEKLKQENAALRHYNATLAQSNATLTEYYHEFQSLRAKFDECCKSNETLHVYATNVFNEYKGLEAKVKNLQEELVKKQEWYSDVFDRQQKKYKAIAETLEKYKTAKTLMYDLLEYILSFSSTNTSDKISDTLDKVYKLVTPVSRGDTQETPNKL